MPTKARTHKPPGWAPRASACSRGYDRRWRKFRRDYLEHDPLCRHCKREGRVVVATEIDHIIPLRQGGSQYDMANLQPLCKRHHSIKTSTEIERTGGMNG